MHMIPFRFTLVLLLAMFGGAGAGAFTQNEINARILKEAKIEAGKHIPYCDKGGRLDYPGGDVPANSGVCTDLVVRVLRRAVGLDLQKVIKEDKQAYPELYHPYKKNNPPDTDLDHRRCRNQIVWMRRHCDELTGELHAATIREDWLPGDIVFFSLEGDEYPWHVGVISDKRDSNGIPMVIDSFPPSTGQTRYLDQFQEYYSHFRITPETLTGDGTTSPPLTGGGPEMDTASKDTSHIRLRKPSWSGKPLTYPSSTVGWRAAGKLLVLPEAPRKNGDAADIARRVVAGARAEVKRGVRYDGAGYIRMDFPGGDVPPEMGVCTDLVVRAFRNAGLDLQEALYADRSTHPNAYPNLRRLTEKRANYNIDHRRCTNLVIWFRRHAKKLTTKIDAAHLDQWRGGDVVFFYYADSSDPWHTAIVSDERDPETGMPKIIDLWPPTARDALCLDQIYEIGSHFRITELPPKLR